MDPRLEAAGLGAAGLGAAGLGAAGLGAHWKAWWKRGRVVALRLELNTAGRGCRDPSPSPPTELS